MHVRRRTTVVLLLVLAAALGLLARVHWVSRGSAAEAKEVYEQLRVFSEALDLVKENYVRAVEDNKLIEGAISGMLKTLDPHSSYLDPDAYKELQVETKGSFGGIGVEITIRDGMLTIVSP